MKYFYQVHAQADKENEILFYIQINEDTEKANENNGEDKVLPLTHEKLRENKIFAEFIGQKKLKKVSSVPIFYRVYKTEETNVPLVT